MRRRRSGRIMKEKIKEKTVDEKENEAKEKEK
jgi:hypothetical protein